MTRMVSKIRGEKIDVNSHHRSREEKTGTIYAEKKNGLDEEKTELSKNSNEKTENRNGQTV